MSYIWSECCFKKRARTVTVVVAGAGINIYAGISWHGLAVRIDKLANSSSILNLKENLF